MPTPITSASPALSYLVTQHGASSVYVQKIISVVNASPYLNQLFNEFESRTLPGGSKPLIANREIGVEQGNWSGGKLGSDTNFRPLASSLGRSLRVALDARQDIGH